MEKFKWHKFFVYLTIGLCILGGWGYINYLNYVEIDQAVTAQISANNTIIDSTVEDIEQEQDQLRHVQQVYEEPPRAMMAPPSGGSYAVAPPAPIASSVPEVDELQKRIDELEKEKQYYLNEKGRISKEIADVVSLFKVDVKNPLINVVFLPLLAYFLKKLMDFLFNRLEEKFHHET